MKSVLGHEFDLHERLLKGWLLDSVTVPKCGSVCLILRRRLNRFMEQCSKDARCITSCWILQLKVSAICVYMKSSFFTQLPVEVDHQLHRRCVKMIVKVNFYFILLYFDIFLWDCFWWFSKTMYACQECNNINKYFLCKESWSLQFLIFLIFWIKLSHNSCSYL